MKFKALIFFFACALTLSSQTGKQNAAASPTTDLSGQDIYTIVEEQAEFPGGVSAMSKYLANNITYPASAREAGLAGKCFLKFVVTAQGKITNIEVLKGFAGCPECDQEIVRAVKSMPDWKPGKMNGKAVNMYYNLPVVYHAQ